MARRAAWRLAATLALLSGPVRPAPAASVLDHIMASIAALPARRASFTEEKRLSSLSQPLESRGVLVYRPPDHLEKDTETPRRESLVIDGDTLTIAEGDAAPRRVPLDESPVLRALADTLLAVVAGDITTLRRLYDVQEQGDAGAWRLLLLPIQPGLRTAVARVTVDGSGTDIRQIDIQQRNGDEQRMTIQAIP